MCWRAEVVDRRGRVVKWRRGRNVITDYGMDQLASNHVGVHVTGGAGLIDFLHVGDTTQTLKRVASSVDLTIDYSAGAADIDITTDVNFFEAGDNGRTLKIAGFPELLIDGYTSEQAVHATARGGTWLPGFDPDTPGTGPHTDFGVHYTNTATLASQTQRFNTYDTAASNFRASINDSSNDQWICQRIFLSAEVSGTAWTVNQLGWGSSASSTNCFGKTNLGSPLVVPVGNKLRVTLQVFSAYTPINLTGVVLDWGATVGSHTCDIQQERISKDGARFADDLNPAEGENFRWNALLPNSPVGFSTGAWTSAFSLGGVFWDGDAGFTSLNSRTKTGVASTGTIFDSTYTNGSHFRTRRFRWPDTVAITSATGLFAGGADTSPAVHYPPLSIRPQSGTITKPSGFWIEVQFPIHWTRELIN